MSRPESHIRLHMGKFEGGTTRILVNIKFNQIKIKFTRDIYTSRK